MAAIPNLNIYTPAELEELSTAVKAERLRRITGGTVQSSSKNAVSYSMHLIPDDQLSMLEDQLARKLGKQPSQARRIDFS